MRMTVCICTMSLLVWLSVGCGGEERGVEDAADDEQTDGDAEDDEGGDLPEALSVLTVTPGDGESDIPLDRNVVLSFNLPVEPTTVTDGMVTVASADGVARSSAPRSASPSPRSRGSVIRRRASRLRSLSPALVAMRKR